MAEATVPYGRKTSGRPPSRKCTSSGSRPASAATATRFRSLPPPSPASRTCILGAIPGLPKVHLHNPVLAYENGDEFMKYWYLAEQGKLDPFVLVVEGSIPNETIKKEGYWAALGHRQAHRPADHRPTNGSTASRPRRWRSSPSAPVRPTAASTRWKATPPAPWGCSTTSAGTGRPRPASRSSACRAARSSPITSWRPCSTCSIRWPALSPMIPLDDAHRPNLALRQHRARRLRPRRLLRRRQLRRRVRLAQMPGQARLLGAGRAMQRPQARLDGRHRRLPQRRRNLHRLHHARLPRQVHAVHGRTAGVQAVLDGHRPLRPDHPLAAEVHQHARSTTSRNGGTAAPS